MILRELQQYGSHYNDALKSFNPLRVRHGVTLSYQDIHHIEYLLMEGVSKLNMVGDLKTNDGRFKPLFTEETVSAMLYAAGLTDTRSTTSQLLGLATEIATKWKLLEETRR